MYQSETEVTNMSNFLILFGVLWLIYKICEESSWNTNAYENKEYDVTKAFEDACCKRISNREFKRNYKNGKYSK